MISICPAYLHWGQISANLKIQVVGLDPASGILGPLTGIGETPTLKGSAIVTGSKGSGFSKRLRGGRNIKGVKGRGGFC